MRTTKRKEFIKFLVNLGLDVETANNFIKCYYKDKPLFAVSDDRQFQSEVTGYLENLDGGLPYKIYSEVRKYASLYIKERTCEYETEIEKEGKTRPNWMTRWLGEAVRDCERENKLENDLDRAYQIIESDYEAGRQENL